MKKYNVTLTIHKEINRIVRAKTKKEAEIKLRNKILDRQPKINTKDLTNTYPHIYETL